MRRVRKHKMLTKSFRREGATDNVKDMTFGCSRH